MRKPTEYVHVVRPETWFKSIADAIAVCAVKCEHESVDVYKEQRQKQKHKNYYEVCNFVVLAMYNVHCQ